MEEALDLILERAQVLPSQSVSLADASGRVLVEPANARVDLPPFASSAMDGFALRAADSPGTLPIAFRVPAGKPGTATLPARSAAAIATGGAVPGGADAVVPVEETVDRGQEVEIAVAVREGAHIRPRGGDVREGETVVSPPLRLGPTHVGALAAAGVPAVVCGRRPRVAVLATGSELRAPGETLAPGQIFESNGTMIAAALALTGAVVNVLPLVADEEEPHRDALAEGLTHDVLVTSGGVSVGPHDLVRRIEADLGVHEVFWGVAVKPGKPLSFGVRDRTLVFGLPGNPVSSLVGSLLFVRPALLALQGLRDAMPMFQQGEAPVSLRRNLHRDEFVRARRRVEDGRIVLEPIVGQESHMIVRAASADALVHVPRGDGEIVAGEPLRYLALA
jgi:molybdopterin molybdotransferase